MASVATVKTTENSATKISAPQSVPETTAAPDTSVNTPVIPQKTENSAKTTTATESSSVSTAPNTVSSTPANDAQGVTQPNPVTPSTSTNAEQQMLTQLSEDNYLAKVLRKMAPKDEAVTSKDFRTEFLGNEFD